MKPYIVFGIMVCFMVIFIVRSYKSKQGLWYESEAMQTFMLLCLFLGIVGSLGFMVTLWTDIYDLMKGWFPN